MWLNMHHDVKNRKTRRSQRQADILHEFGHALGLVHEHTHPGCKADWNYEVLGARYNWPREVVEFNFRRLERKGLRLTRCHVNWQLGIAAT
jgi:hypothetical protein